MKKFFKRFLFKENGSVTIFSILMIMPIFMFNALFIDSIRIISAQKQVEANLEAALRSTMSNFNSDSINKGLIVYDQESGDPNTIFQNYLKQSEFSSGELSGFDNLINVKYNMSESTASFNEDRKLVVPEVFDYQVKETMKYQAPIQFGAQIMDIFQEGKEVDSAEVEDIQNAVEQYEEIADLIIKRNKKIDEIGSVEQELINNLRNIKAKTFKGNFEKYAKEITITSKKYAKILDVMESFKPYYDDIKTTSEGDTPDDKNGPNFEHQVKSKEFIKVMKSDKISGQVKTHREPLFGGKNKHYEDKQNADSSALYYQQELEEIFEGFSAEGNERIAESVANIRSSDIGLDFFKQMEEDMAFIEEQVVRNEVAPTDVNLYKNVHEEYSYVEIYNSLLDLMDLSREQIRNQPFNNYSAQAQKLYGALEDKIVSIDERIKSIEESWEKYEKAKESINGLDEDGNEIEAEEKEDEADESFFDLVEKITDLMEHTEEDVAIYEELNTTAGEYASAAGKGYPSIILDDLDSEERDNFITQAFEKFKEFIEFTKGYPNSITKELYNNEYILGYYGVDGPYDLKDLTQTLDFEKKKALYIMYGNNSTATNYGQLILEITLILFVINFVVELAKGGFLNIAKFLHGLVVAFKKTADQVIELTKEGSTPLSISKTFSGKGKSPRISVPLWTRMLLLMRSMSGDTFNNDKKYRTLAVATKDTGVNYNSSGNTYLEGTANGEINILFFPLLFEGFGDTDGKRFTIERTKIFSY